MKKLPTVVLVQYKTADKYHVFTSEDLFGLYAGNQNLKTAFEAVPPSIQTLIKLNLGIDTVVEPTLHLYELVAALKSKDEQKIPRLNMATDRYFIIRPTN